MKFVHFSTTILLFVFASSTGASTVSYDFGDTTLAENTSGSMELFRTSEHEKSFDFEPANKLAIDIKRYNHDDPDAKHFLNDHERQWRRHVFEHDGCCKHYLPTEPSAVPLPKSAWLFGTGIAFIGIGTVATRRRR